MVKNILCILSIPVNQSSRSSRPSWSGTFPLLHFSTSFNRIFDLISPSCPSISSWFNNQCKSVKSVVPLLPFFLPFTVKNIPYILYIPVN
jgi:hypothetical protein